MAGVSVGSVKIYKIAIIRFLFFKKIEANIVNMMRLDKCGWHLLHYSQTFQSVDLAPLAGWICLEVNGARPAEGIAVCTEMALSLWPHRPVSSYADPTGGGESTRSGIQDWNLGPPPVTRLQLWHCMSWSHVLASKVSMMKSASQTSLGLGSWWGKQRDGSKRPCTWGPRDDPSKWSKPDKGRQISYGITYMWNLKIWYKWTYLQNRNRRTDTENKFMVTKGER